MVVEAIYRNGVFEPTQAVTVPEGTKVEVRLPQVAGDSHPLLELAGIWDEQTADQVERFIEDVFEQVHPGDYPSNAQ